MQEQQNNGIPTNPLCSWFYDTKNFNLGRFSVSNICPRIKKLDYINEILLIFLDRSCLIWNMKKIFGYLVGLNFVTFFFFFTSHNFSFFFLKLLVISLIFLWHKSATSAIHHLTLHNWCPISRISLFISKFKCREWSGPDPKLKKCTLCNLVSLNTSFFSLWFFCVINNCICRKHKMRREHWA